jgi:hypothetical protein|tara:strand:+ start:347 stop:508 length:162 start_codon:yes stop_codon:yes gene_type:complete
MKIKLKKSCNVAEHGMLGASGDLIHLAKESAEELVKKGLAEHISEEKPKSVSK